MHFISSIFLFNVLFGPLTGSTKTELPIYKKKNPRGFVGGKKHSFCHSDHPPSLAKPHARCQKEIRSPKLPRFRHVTHKRKRMTEIHYHRRPLNHCFLLRSIITIRSVVLVKLVPSSLYCIAYPPAIGLRAGCSSPV